MKRLALLFLLILLPLAAAEEKTIHDGWHPYADYFAVGADYYDFSCVQIQSGDSMLVKALIKRNQASYIITTTARYDDDEGVFAFDEEACTTDEPLRICLVNLSMEPEKMARNDEYGTYRYGTRIKIYEKQAETAELTLDRVIQNPTLHLDEQTRVTVTITNTGVVAAKNIRYTEFLPPDLDLTRLEGYSQKSGQELIVNPIPSLYPGKSLTYNYWIRPNEYTNKTTLSANITYEDPEAQTLTDKDTITIIWPYTYAATIGSKEAKIDETSRITVTVTNNDDEPLTRTTTIATQNGVTEQAIQGFAWTSLHRYACTQTIAPGEQDSCILDMQSAYVGVYNITSQTVMTVKERTFQKASSFGLSIKHDMVTPSLVLSKKKMRSGEPITIGVYLHNEDDEIAFFDIQGGLHADFINESFTLARITSDEHKNVIFKTYYPPKTDEVVVHTISVNGTFKTQSSQVNTFSTSQELTILPAGQSVLLSQTAGPASVKRGEDVTITVEAENVADSGYKAATIKDTYDKGLEKTFGDNVGAVNLFGGEKKQVYFYRLRVPFNYTKGNFTITSEMLVEGEPVRTARTIITVTDPLLPGQQPPPQEQPAQEPAEDQAEEEEQPAPVEQPQPSQTVEPKEKKKFFADLLDGIAGFFANIFG